MSECRRRRGLGLAFKIRLARAYVLGTPYADDAGFVASLLCKAFGRSTGRINVKALIAYDRWIFPASRALITALSPVIGKNLIVVAKATT